MIWHLQPKENGNIERINQGLDFLKNTDLGALTPGDTIKIDGDNLYALVQEYETLPAESVKCESHDLYTDIQYVVSGVESFGCVPRTGLTESAAYNPAKDITFYNMPKDYQAFTLNPGECIVVTPEVAHMPKGQLSGPCKVKKIVLKVKH